jgi:hypothetical protein
MELPMSLSSLLEIGLTLAGLGTAIGFWLYAARYAEPRDVTLVLGAALGALRRNRDR